MTTEREAERAAIVKWLEQWITDTLGQDVDPQYMIEVIENGQHLQEQSHDK